MFDILFGWSKASKCKKAIKSARSRLGLLKNKRQAIVRQLRKDLAELIQSGHEETAFNRVEQLIEDESLSAAYELLDHFCQFILTQLAYIRRNKDCPNDINEAVSSLIFASARCGNIPELCAIRKLFGKRYGEKFVTTAIELFPGNLVNKQLKENLSQKFVADDLKYRMVDEIARDTCLQKQFLAIQYYPDWQQLQVKDNKGCQVVGNDVQIKDTNAGSKVHSSEFEEIKSDVTCFNSYISKPSESCSSVQKYPPYILSSPLQKNLEKKKDFPVLFSVTTNSMQNKEESMALACSEERVSLPSYPEEMVDYVDDIEECRFSVSKHGACQDQMLFKFRSSGLSKRQKTQFDCDESDMIEDESLSEKSSIRSSRKCNSPPEKISRRRSTSREYKGVMDLGYLIYNHRPHKCSTHHSGKHQKPSSSKILESCQSEDGSGRKQFNLKMTGCSLNHPCYFSIHDGNDCLEGLSINPNRGINGSHIQQGTKLVRSKLRDQIGASEYHEFDYPEYKVGNGNNEIKEVTFASKGSYESANVSNPRTNVSLPIETEVPYLRAMTMPQERHRKSKDKDKILRTYSCPSQHPNHVHPKLPDYDDIAAKFTALKRKQLQNKKLD
ncbi:hypothetical protein TanjilG_16146 [Lupinus angustifolius]|uniref:IST1-like protein n=1 Tax=Lupinus angustifolius TaxID=3871 RepID=A0A394DBA6_LUPAN|nr:PREDICTED: uncharacterized protein LOC109338583 [Lupinus angustifolius]XP_019431401.1 PREDICTED: uncharacterized protein LOC109338583 [Lupinus angustifolius]OIW20612.1 hypothetical protein TanjilG_16146 [Lupinus angustifolius]